MSRQSSLQISSLISAWAAPILMSFEAGVETQEANPSGTSLEKHSVTPYASSGLASCVARNTLHASGSLHADTRLRSGPCCSCCRHLLAWPLPDARAMHPAAHTSIGLITALVFSCKTGVDCWSLAIPSYADGSLQQVTSMLMTRKHQDCILLLKTTRQGIRQPHRFERACSGRYKALVPSVEVPAEPAP